MSSQDVEDVFDYVIVGAGSAGCVLADRLTESGASVLLLEAGPADHHYAMRIPAAAVRLPRHYNWRYAAEPDESRNGLVDYWAGGKVIGGSSSINGMFWVRGNRWDFDQWAWHGATGWDYESVLPYFKAIEAFRGGGDPAFRGRSGPQRTDICRVDHVLNDAFIDAAQEAGHPRNPDYNGEHQDGVGRAEVSQRWGLRWSAAKGFLARAKHRKNLTLRSEAFVHRVVLDGKRATGVEYTRRGRTSVAGARREVILSAGAIASPRLLMLSGIGPGEHLRSTGVPIVHDLPGVGTNLQEHLYATMQYATTVKTLNRYMTPGPMTKAAIEFLTRRRGPITAVFANVVLFGSVDSVDHTDYEITFAPLGLTSEGGPPPKGVGPRAVAEQPRHDIHGMKLMKIPACNVLPSIVHPQARGTITLRSSNPHDTPVIEHQLVDNEADVAGLVACARVVREVMNAPAMKQYVRYEVLPGDKVQTADEWLEFLRTYSFRGEHPVGTCRMGTDSLAVVDPSLRVHGIDALRVIDASVMPAVTSGNTNAPTMMIAARGADLVLGR